MYKTVTRWNQGVPEAHISEGEKTKIIMAYCQVIHGTTPKVFTFYVSLEGRIEPSLVIGEHLQRTKILIFSLLFYAS